MGIIYDIKIIIMAILLRKNNEKIYFTDKGLVTEKEKTRADVIDQELNDGMQRLLRMFLKEHLIAKNGRKKDALRIWFNFGKFLSNLANKYKILGSEDEMYFWQAVYDHLPTEFQKNPPPKDFRRLSSNQYRKAAIMAEYSWRIIKRVGKWAVWNDILDNPKILSDKRILDRVIDKLLDRRAGHKEIRKFLYAISRRLHKIDTKVLTDKELEEKMEDVSISEFLN